MMSISSNKKNKDMKSKKYYEVREHIVAFCYRLEIGGFQVFNNKTREKRFFARNSMDEFKIWYQTQLEEGTDEKSIDINWIRTGAAESEMMDRLHTFLSFNDSKNVP